MPRHALVATMRNEGPFLIEWVAYHRLIGFDEILVCTNDCVDGSPDLLDVLQDRGLVRHLRCTPAPGEKAQIVAYAAAERVLAADWPDVLMVLDADEFLNVHVGDRRLADLLAAVPDATAVLVNWRIFGSAGHPDWSPRPVTGRFTRAARRDSGVNWPFKTLFRNPQAYHCPLLPHGPGFARDGWPGLLRAVDGGGAVLPDRYARADTFLQSEPGTVSWRLAQVNHYNTRSRADYLAKHHRGGGQGPGRWDRDANWVVFDRNEEEDRTIRHWTPALEEAMAALLAHAPVRAAHDRCCLLYRRHLAALAAA
ncbi:glycosyltransferase family 2 protein [Sphingomonas bacterium]|uniref:glycosyltransferase family 2 protein n=1 Tax=Sphingomonas bacterium TaxID=1895847 RepID=UPI0020C71B72|nr:glycosyltransferase family 2 protein [Sphingomonas bacterium]